MKRLQKYCAFIPCGGFLGFIPEKHFFGSGNKMLVLGSLSKKITLLLVDRLHTK